MAIFDGRTYNVINGSGGADRIFGRLGDDWIKAGNGNDTIIDLVGNNVFDGGAGSDNITGGLGRDIFVHKMAENGGAADRYNGGLGRDTLHLEFTLAEWDSQAVQNDIARFLAHLATPQNQALARLGLTTEFTFQSMNLRVTNIENIRIFVEGKEFSAKDDGVSALNDTLTVNSANVASVDLLANDSAPDRVASVTLVGANNAPVSQIETQYGTLTLAPSLAGGTQTANLTFTPNAAYATLAAGASVMIPVSYTIRDVDGDEATATVNVTITGVNDAPTAPTTKSIEIDEDIPSAAIAIDANDVDNDTLTYTTKANAGPSKGAVTFDQVAGTFTYTPTANANGQDSFTIVIDDGKGGKVEQIVTVTIKAVNDAPTAETITAALTETQSLFDPTSKERTNNGPDPQEIDLLATATDVDGDDLSVISIDFVDGQPDYITLVDNKLVVDVNSRALDDLTEGGIKTLTATYTISDGNGGLKDNTVEIVITGTKDLYREVGTATAEVTHLRSQAGLLGNLSNTLNLNPNNLLTDKDDAFHFALTGEGSISFQSRGLTGLESITVTDTGARDWNPLFNVMTQAQPNLAPVDLRAGALNDGGVNYNVQFVSLNANDAVTVKVDYDVSYYHYA